MPSLTSARFLRLLLILVAVMGLSSCMAYQQPRSSVYVHSGPPLGVVAYDYWYYPDVQVYFDINRRIYFYYSNHRWIQTRVLPAQWRSRLHGHVLIKSRHQRPYLEYNEHLRKYPPRYREQYERNERREYREQRYDNRDKQPRIIQTIPRKEPLPRNYRDDRYEHTPPQTNSRVKVPARERNQEPPRRVQQEHYEYRDKQPRIIQTIPRKEPRSKARGEVPVRNRHEETQREIKAKTKAHTKGRNKDDKDSGDDDQRYDRRDRLDQNDR